MAAMRDFRIVVVEKHLGAPAFGEFPKALFRQFVCGYALMVDIYALSQERFKTIA